MRETTIAFATEKGTLSVTDNSTDARYPPPTSPAAGTATEGGLPLTAWLANEVDPQLVRELLHEVIDPELGVNIVDLGLVYGIRIAERVVRVRMTLTTPGCPLSGYIDDEIRRTLVGIPGVDDTDVDIVWDPAWNPEMMSELAKAQLGWRR